MRTLCLVVLLSLPLGCASEAVPSPPADSPDAEGPLDAEDAATACAPGSVSECTGDDAARVCRRDGSGWEVLPCTDDRGEPTRCQNGACLTCTPLDRRCRDDDTVELCRDDGSEWVETQSCNGLLTGQICQLGTCIALCEINQKLNSYFGCEYWGADLDNGFVTGPGGGVLDAAGAQYALIVSNPDPRLPAEVTIHDSDGVVTHDSQGQPFPTGKLLPRSLRVYELPRRDVNGTVLAPLAYRVTTSVPTVVYQLNPLADVEVYSNDASLLLPSHVLGRWYYVMSREQTHEGIRAYLSVLGVRPDTEVTVRVSARTLAGGDIPALMPGETLTRTLGPFDVLNIETNGRGEDLTGSQVVSTRAVAVFGGSEGANAPNTERCDLSAGVCEYDQQTPCEDHGDCAEFITCCADHIEQQLFPVDAWGTRYICARTQARGDEPEVWRVMAASDGTVITAVPPQGTIPVLNAGEWIELTSWDDFELSSDRPFLVGQFMVAEQAPDPGLQAGDAGTGDPAFMLVPPAEQLRSDYVVLTPPDYEANYINVVAPMTAQVSADGAPIGPLDPVGTGEYGVARLPVAEGVHVLVGDAPFAVTVYGYDQYVSYGYPGGLDLKGLGLVKPPPGATE